MQGFRIQGLSNSFKKASTAAANRKIGDLVHINAAGEATTLVGDKNLAFPLMRPLDFENDQVAEAQIDGVAPVNVEESDNITVGSPLTIGATGVGVAVAEEGDVILGIALKVPTGDGDQIPMLIQIYPKAENIY